MGNNVFKDLKAEGERFVHALYHEKGAALFFEACQAWLANWPGLTPAQGAVHVDFCEGYYFELRVPDPRLGVELHLTVEMETCRPELAVSCPAWQSLGPKTDFNFVLPVNRETGEAVALPVEAIAQTAQRIEALHATARRGARHAEARLA